MICSLLLKEKSQKKNTGHSVEGRKNLINSIRKCLKMVSFQKRLAIRQRNSFSGMLLTMLQALPSHQKILQKSSIKNIISSSRSAATDTAIFIQAEKNISLDEISEHDMKKIFYYRHLRKMQNHSLIGKWKLKNRKFQILQKICRQHLLLILPIFLYRSFSSNQISDL